MKIFTKKRIRKFKSEIEEVLYNKIDAIILERMKEFDIKRLLAEEVSDELIGKISTNANTIVILNKIARLENKVNSNIFYLEGKEFSAKITKII